MTHYIAYDAVPALCSAVFSVGITGVALGFTIANYRQHGTIFNANVARSALLAYNAPAWSTKLVQLYDSVMLSTGLADPGVWFAHQRAGSPVRAALGAAIGLATPARRLREFMGDRLNHPCFADSSIGDAVYYVLVFGLAYWVQHRCASVRGD